MAVTLTGSKSAELMGQLLQEFLGNTLTFDRRKVLAALLELLDLPGECLPKCPELLPKDNTLD